MSEVCAEAHLAKCPSVQAPLTVLLLAQLPPPVHGVTSMTARVARLLAEADGIAVDHRWSGSAVSLTDIDSKSVAKLAQFAGLNLTLLGRTLRAQRSDIVYATFVPWSHAAVRDALIAWWGKRLGRRTLLHLHGEGLDEIVSGRSLKARLVRPLIAGTELIAITAGAAATAEASGLFTRVVRLPNAASDPGFDEAAGPVLRLGFLGNLDPRKGVLRFVDTLGALIEAGLPVRGDIAGASTRHLSVDALRDLITARGLTEHVTAHGPLHGADKDRFLGNLDVLVYLSQHDHAPLVLIEGLAAGLVPIALDTGGVAELAGPDFKSHVLPSGLPDDELTTRIVSLVRGYVDAPAALRTARRQARSRYEAEYTEARFNARWLEILAQGPASARVGEASPAVATFAASSEVRVPLPSQLKSPVFAAARALHLWPRRPLPDRIAIYFHALDSADQTALAQCVATVRDLGYRTVSFDDYIDPATTGRICNISFDDNYRNWHRSLPLLAELELKATFFTNSLPFRDTCEAGLVANYFDRLAYTGEREPLSRAELAGIAAAGHEIGCHTHSHAMLARLPRSRWDSEILASKHILEDVTGRPVHHLSWPFGMPRHITEALKDYCLSIGFRSLAAATPGMLHDGPVNRRNVPRTAWRANRSPADNVVDLSIDGRLFTRLTGRSVIG